MPKHERGLPSGFGLRIAEEPAEPLGDYLDEEERYEERAKTKSAERLPEKKPPRKPPPPVMEVPAPPKIVRPARKPPRTQLNMRPDTAAKLDEVLQMVRMYSPQKDASAAEVFAGLIEAVHAAKDHLDFGHVPERGQWGSIAAKNFRAALGRVFLRGVTSYCLETEAAPESE